MPTEQGGIFCIGRSPAPSQVKLIAYPYLTGKGGEILRPSRHSPAKGQKKAPGRLMQTRSKRGLFSKTGLALILARCCRSQRQPLPL